MKERVRIYLTAVRRRAIAVVAIGLAATLVAGCKGGDAAPPKVTTQVAQAQGTQATVSVVKRGSITDVAEVTGALAALNDVTVSVKAAGKIKAVYVREGDVVRAGQVVVQQDPSDLQAQLDQSRANLTAAETRLNSAKVSFETAQTTLKLTADQTQSAVRLAQAGLSAAKDEAAVVTEGSRPQEIEQAEENLKAAKADREKARADLKRYNELAREQAVSAQQLDQVQSIADAAEARCNSADQALSLTKEGSRPEDIRRAQSAVEQARQQLITAQSNLGQVSLRHSDVENARVGILTAAAAVEQAKAGMRLAQQALNDTSVRAPIDGVVAERKVEPGSQATQSQAVARIVDLRSIYFDGQLSESQYSEVRPGQHVVVTIDALPGRRFQGSVGKIFPVASSMTRSFTIRINLRNEGNALRPQMFARGEITLATHSNVPLVPRDAVLDFTGTKGRVFVDEDGVARERQVTAGFTTISSIEIRSGLKPGDRIVTQGQAQLQSGDRLQVAPPATIGASNSSDIGVSQP